MTQYILREGVKKAANVTFEWFRSEDSINNALIGTMATMMAGTKGDSTLYAIGDYLYIGSGSKERPRDSTKFFWLCCTKMGNGYG